MRSEEETVGRPFDRNQKRSFPVRSDLEKTKMVPPGFKPRGKTTEYSEKKGGREASPAWKVGVWIRSDYSISPPKR
jgi:hypothetical protein